jgi:hypothetical protein
MPKAREVLDCPRLWSAATCRRFSPNRDLAKLKFFQLQNKAATGRATPSVTTRFLPVNLTRLLDQAEDKNRRLRWWRCVR